MRTILTAALLLMPTWAFASEDLCTVFELRKEWTALKEIAGKEHNPIKYEEAQSRTRAKAAEITTKFKTLLGGKDETAVTDFKVVVTALSKSPSDKGIYLHAAAQCSYGNVSVTALFEPPSMAKIPYRSEYDLFKNTLRELNEGDTILLNGVLIAYRYSLADGITPSFLRYYDYTTNGEPSITGLFDNASYPGDHPTLYMTIKVTELKKTD